MRARSSLSLAVLLFASLGSACGDDASNAPNDPPGANDTDAGTDADNGSDGDSGPDDDADADTKPAIGVDDLAVRVPLHGSVEVKIAVTRSGEAEGEIQLSIQGDLPKGVSLSETDLTIPAGENEAVVTFSSDDEVEALGVESTLELSAKSGDLEDKASLTIEVAALVTKLGDEPGPGTLRDMVESAPLLAPNPTIGFAPWVFSGTHYVYLGSPLLITKSLTIEGPPFTDEPRIVLHAQLTGRVVELQFDAGDEHKEVTFSGLEFQGGKTDQNGGCIHSDGAILTLDKVVFSRCKGKDGGGLYAQGGEVRINNSTFWENVSSAHGGGVAVQSPHWIENSLFEGNESGATGGGLFARWWGETKNTRFIDNHAKDLGGAIRAHSLTTTLLTIEDSHFEGNYAHSGGAVSAVSPTTIKASTFHKNEARDERGGAIVKHGNAHELSIDSTSFTENSAIKFGGAIAANNGSSISITNSRFQKNTSGDGGGLYVKGAEAKVLSSIFEENTVTNDGGAIFVDEGQLRLVKSTLSENRAYYGGGLSFAGHSNSSFIGLSTIANNSATYGGGIDLSAWGTSSLFVEYSTIANNSGAEAGGGFSAILADSGALSLRGNIIAANRVASGGIGPDMEIDESVPPGAIVSKGYNLLGNLAGSGRTCAAFHATDPCEMDPKLGDLADNGGSMKTVLPKADSPAIDAIPQAACSESEGKTIWPDWDELANLLEKDQRDLPRPSGARCDIGAVETQ